VASPVCGNSATISVADFGSFYNVVIALSASLTRVANVFAPVSVSPPSIASKRVSNSFKEVLTSVLTAAALAVLNAVSAIAFVAARPVSLLVIVFYNASIAPVFIPICVFIAEALSL